MVDTIRNVKDYYLKEMTITAYNGSQYDISNIRGNLYIYEDLFSPFMSIQLELVDTMDLPTLLPMIGEEKIRIIFTKQDPDNLKGFLDDVVLDFEVFKMTDRQTTQSKTQIYTLHLMTAEALNNQTEKVFKSWKHKKYSDMVKDVFDIVKETKEIVIEPTRDEYNLCLGNKTPFELISMIMGMSIPENSQHRPPYLFYEGRDAFHFTSLDALILAPSKEIYSRRIANTMDPKDFSRQIPDDYRRIEFMDWNGNLDTMKLLTIGHYGSEVLAINSLQRSYETKSYKPTTDWAKYNKLEKDQPFTNGSRLLDSTMAHRKVVSTNLGIDTLNSDERSFNLEEYMIDRTAKLSQIYYNRMSISVPGDPRRKVGDVITLELPEEAGDVDDTRPEKANRYYYGNHLVIAIKHHISYTSYTMDMELARDSFRAGIEHEDPKVRYDPTF